MAKESLPTTSSEHDNKKAGEHPICIVGNRILNERTLGETCGRMKGILPGTKDRTQCNSADFVGEERSTQQRRRDMEGKRRNFTSECDDVIVETDFTNGLVDVRAENYTKEAVS